MAIKSGVMGTTDLVQPIEQPVSEAPSFKEDEVCYETIPAGDVFNTALPNGKRITFAGGRYSTKKQAEIEWLQHFVEEGKLTVVQAPPQQLELEPGSDADDE